MMEGPQVYYRPCRDTCIWRGKWSGPDILLPHRWYTTVVVHVEQSSRRSSLIIAELLLVEFILLMYMYLDFKKMQLPIHMCTYVYACLCMGRQIRDCLG